MKVYELLVSTWKLSENKDNVSLVCKGSIDLYKRKKDAKKDMKSLAHGTVQIANNLYETPWDENGIQLVYEIVKRYIKET